MSGDARFDDVGHRTRQAEQFAVSIQALTGQPPDAGGDIGRRHGAFHERAWLRDSAKTSKTKSIRFAFDARSVDIPKHFTIHQAGLVPRDPAGVVGHATNLVDSAQYHQRNSAPLFINDVDPESLGMNFRRSRSRDIADARQAERKDQRASQEIGRQGFLW
ncbi:MAG: hypothetical protein AB7U73_00555 [Pirellulales bacterium]